MPACLAACPRVTFTTMNIEQLKTFHRVAQLGSFTRAAQELFITQPAVSLQIQALETAMGVPLFDRSRRRVRLTGEGETLFAYTSRVFALFDEIKTVFQNMNSLQTGQLSLGATLIMAAYHMTPLIARFHRRFPGVALDVLIGNSHRVEELVQSGEVELGFSPVLKHSPSLRQIFLHREPFVMVTAPTSPLAVACGALSGALPLEQLMDVPFVLREKGARTHDKVCQWFRANSPEGLPRHVLTLSDMEATKRLVAGGYGVTALPKAAVEDEIAHNQLALLQVESFSLHTDYYLVCQEGKTLSRAALAFLSLLYEDGMPIPEELLAGCYRPLTTC